MKDFELSKLMSQLLRHDQHFATKSQMTSEGYVDIWRICDRFNVSRKQIEKVCRQNDKQRFQIKGDQIRANQGHSISNVDSRKLYKPIKSAAQAGDCLHGTYPKVLQFIQAEGLKAMGRNDVHFAKRARSRAGLRYDAKIALKLDVDRWLAEGKELYESANGVILVPESECPIPFEYFEVFMWYDSAYFKIEKIDDTWQWDKAETQLA